MTTWSLVSDVGGTNMRFAAISPTGDVVDQTTFPSAGTTPFAKAAADFCTQMGNPPVRAVAAGAGPVEDGTITLTNVDQRISEIDLAPLTTHGHARVINDFAAAAWALVGVGEEDLTTLFGRFNDDPKPRLVLGPGTGLGVAGLVWHEGKPVVVPGEGGHIRIGAANAREAEVLAAFTKRFPEFAMGSPWAVEGEGILSGLGLPKLFAAMSGEAEERTTRDVFEAAKAKEPLAKEAVDLFVRWLGRLAGDLSVVFKATGGIYICGGVAVANPWIFEDGAFVDAVQAGGRFTELRREFPILLAESGDFGIKGGINYLAHNPI